MRTEIGSSDAKKRRVMKVVVITVTAIQLVKSQTGAGTLSGIDAYGRLARFFAAQERVSVLAHISVGDRLEAQAYASSSDSDFYFLQSCRLLFRKPFLVEHHPMLNVVDLRAGSLSLRITPSVNILKVVCLRQEQMQALVVHEQHGVPCEAVLDLSRLPRNNSLRSCEDCFEAVGYFREEEHGHRPILKPTLCSSISQIQPQVCKGLREVMGEFISGCPFSATAVFSIVSSRLFSGGPQEPVRLPALRGSILVAPHQQPQSSRLLVESDDEYHVCFVGLSAVALNLMQAAQCPLKVKARFVAFGPHVARLHSIEIQEEK